MKKLTILMFMLLLSTAFAEDYVAINSADGRDVLSGVFYANAKNIDVKFMPMPGGNADIFAAKVGGGHDMLLIQGTVPVSAFVQSSLEAKNNSLEIYTSSDGAVTNLELAKRSGVKKFIIVDSAFSDSALSVLPYAANTDSYVILADNGNIDEVVDIVKDADELMIFGYVDSEVKSKLQPYSPEMVGKGQDKFEDNIVMVKRTMQDYSMTDIVIIDGTSLEETVALGQKPILLSGRLVPQGTYNFIKNEVRSGNLLTSLLIGNELVVPIYDMRERMEQEFEDEGLNKSFGIIVKFAQVIPSADTGVLVLDEFPLPAYKPKLEIKEIAYNDRTKKVMVSVDNTGEGPAYFTQEVRVQVDGADYQVFGTNATKLVERGEQLGSEYPLDLSGVPEGNVTAIVIVKYGASSKNLEEYLSSEGPLTTISFTDESDVGVQSARYSDETVKVTIRNNGDDTAYVFAKLRLIVGGSEATISAADVRSMDAGSLIVEEFPLDLTPADIEANKNVSVLIDYGAREGFLLKKAEYIVPLEEGGDSMGILLLAVFGLVILAVLAAIAYFIFGRQKPQKKKKA